MERLVLGLTKRPLILSYLQEAFSKMERWQVIPLLHCSIKTVSSTLSKDSFYSVIIDLPHEDTQMITICRFIASNYPLLKIIALSCCQNTSDQLTHMLLSIGIKNYLICDGDAQQFGLRLQNVLNDFVCPSLRSTPQKRQRNKSPFLSDQDQQLIRLSAQGLRYKAIGDIVGLSHHTVRHRLEALRHRLGVPTLPALAAWAGEQGLLSTSPESTSLPFHE